jgi:hypothetical protein
LRLNGIKRILNDALQEQNLHSKLPENSRRHEWKTSHGMRKWFKTRAEGIMKPLNVELLMGHDTGISDSYWRSTEREVFEDYLKAVDLLTINDVNKKSEIEQIHNKEIEDLKTEQAAIKSVLRKMIADEQDWDLRNPEERKRIEETFQRMMDPKNNFFGDSGGNCDSDE